MPEPRSLFPFLRQSFNTINVERWVGVRIGRLVVEIGKPYRTHNPVDNHVGWKPLAVRWELRWRPR